MRTLFLLALLGVAGWYGYPYFKEHGDEWGRELNRLISGVPVPVLDKKEASEQQEIMKCITAAGKVIYGTPPEGVTCERREKVDGALTVVPSEAIRDGSGLVSPPSSN